ncbi:hypothetical protein [Massilia rubra]|uniref:Uncharacterized protein n=1 Tax=Massilia rubra TaxID=2607910 RepID=A0ABX0LK36_9BURK|nr:hypothetical protein [Massilia rubra]NHZ34550.1 hypothetical protein [Massilia rubra]
MSLFVWDRAASIGNSPRLRVRHMNVQATTPNLHYAAIDDDISRLSGSPGTVPEMGEIARLMLRRHVDHLESPN